MITAVLIYMIPVLTAAMGGLYSDLAGVLNIALEALILAGAFTAYIAASSTASSLMGFFAAGLTGLVLAVLFAYPLLRFKGNIFVGGLGMNLLIPGLVSVLSSQIYGTSGVLHSADFASPPSLFGLPLPYYAALIFIAILWYLLEKTPLGLRIRSVGYNADVSEIRGMNPMHIRLIALAVSGLAGGVAGSLLVLNLEAYVPHISAGRGWIALAAIYLGRKNPRGIVVAAAIFALAEYGSNILQGISELPSSLFLAVPYVITFAALVLQGIIIHRKTLGSEYPS